MCQYAPEFNIITPSLFSKTDSDLGRTLTLQSQIILNQVAEAEKKLNPEKKIFVGYSLGGRIGLHILQQQPDFFERYIFLSTHPGLKNEDVEARMQRKIVDESWAEKLSAESWESFISQWNAQAVFADSIAEPERKSEDFDFKKLQHALRYWSLADQLDMRSTIQKNSHKIEWIVGQRDEKYLQLAEGLKKDRIIRSYEIFDGGHRLHLGCADQLPRLLKPGSMGFSGS